ncbi:hypothetical protein ACN4EG_04310 [Alkalinema pantanalense CENA528]|uniref:hypothetical protein n=1 Tax=Alkalinema pantanalense TaxID=1620705 RepID=UPI003D6FB117
MTRIPYPLLLRFQGSLFGAVLGELMAAQHFCPQSPPQDLGQLPPASSLGQRLIQSTQNLLAVRRETNDDRLLASLDALSSDSSSTNPYPGLNESWLHQTTHPLNVAIGLLPYLLYGHESPKALNHTLETLIPHLSPRHCSLLGLVAGGLALALGDPGKLAAPAQSLQPWLTAFPTRTDWKDFSTEWGVQQFHLRALEDWLTQQRSLYFVQQWLQTRSQIPVEFQQVLQVLYCFLATPEDVMTTINRAIHQSIYPTENLILVGALAGALGGAYNGVMGFPIAWRRGTTVADSGLADLGLEKPMGENQVFSESAWNEHLNGHWLNGSLNEYQCELLAMQLLLAWAGVDPQLRSTMTIPAVTAPRALNLRSRNRP